MKVKDMMLEQAIILKKNSMKLKGKVKPPATETFLELAGGLFTYSQQSRKTPVFFFKCLFVRPELTTLLQFQPFSF